MQDRIHDRIILLLLQNHAFWAEACMGHLPTANGQGAGTHIGTKSPSICRWHGGHHPVEGTTCNWLKRVIHHNGKIQAKVEPGEVRVWSRGREIPGFFAHWTRNPGESREVCFHNKYEKLDLGERSAAIDRAHGRTVQIRIGRRGQGHPYFQCLRRNNRFV